MPTPQYTLTLVGCGKMGGALLQCWLEKNLLREAIIIEPHAVDPLLLTHKNVTHHTAHNGKTFSSDIVVLAVKPQAMSTATEQIAKHLSSETLVLSIAAGQSVQTLESLFAPNQPIIRSMPNTPAAIGKGITAAIANAFVSAAHKDMAQTLLAATGKVAWIDDENQMDAITALSGSGPAYIFYLIEVLAKAGEEMGLSPNLSMDLARQTVIGSAALAENNAETPAPTLRQNVTSPAGTTAAALDVLMDGRFQSLLNEVLTAAKNKSKVLDK